MFVCCSLLTDLVVAGFVLTPVKNLLFDRSPSGCSRGGPLELEISGNGCPAKGNIPPLHLHAKCFATAGTATYSGAPCWNLAMMSFLADDLIARAEVLGRDTAEGGPLFFFVFPCFSAPAS